MKYFWNVVIEFKKILIIFIKIIFPSIMLYLVSDFAFTRLDTRIDQYIANNDNLFIVPYLFYLRGLLTLIVIGILLYLLFKFVKSLEAWLNEENKKNLLVDVDSRKKEKK